jgi:hypothetical protein
VTDFLNVPSFNVGQGPVNFADFTSAPGAPPASLGGFAPRSNSNPSSMGFTTSGDEKIVLLLGLITSIGAGINAFKRKDKRRSMSAIAFSAFPLALLYAGLNQ